MSRKDPYILAIESSCDDTSIALVGKQTHDFLEMRVSQLELHNEYGGVVPELASREHFNQIDHLFRKFSENNWVKERIGCCERVVATLSPGLVGPLMVGSSFARGLSAAMGIPFAGVHHLRGHLASVLLNYQQETEKPCRFEDAARDVFPALVLLVSGGHTAILSVDVSLNAQLLAQTADDAAGECFDKSAKLMGLAYPGGPSIEKEALLVREEELEDAESLFRELPIPRSKEGFSFSGLKTAIRLLYKKKKEHFSRPCFAWAIQKTIALSLAKSFERTAKQKPEVLTGRKSLIFCGGVAANRLIRKSFSEIAKKNSLRLIVPPIRFCTDNAAMIGACAQVQSPEFILSDVNARTPL